MLYASWTKHVVWLFLCSVVCVVTVVNARGNAASPAVSPHLWQQPSTGRRRPMVADTTWSTTQIGQHIQSTILNLHARLHPTTTSTTTTAASHLHGSTAHSTMAKEQR
jgi:hypothetical protein